MRNHAQRKGHQVQINSNDKISTFSEYSNNINNINNNHTKFSAFALGLRMSFHEALLIITNVAMASEELRNEVIHAGIVDYVTGQCLGHHGHILSPVYLVEYDENHIEQYHVMYQTS